MNHGTDEPDSQQDHPGTDIVDPSKATGVHQTAIVPDDADLTIQNYPDTEKLEPGTNFGRYQNLTFIGQGAMARVYKAHDPSLDRTVALKVIRGDEPQMVKRLIMEAHSHAKVEHKHVCKIYEVGEAESKPYIAMQYINGRTLKEVMPELNIQEKV